MVSLADMKNLWSSFRPYVRELVPFFALVGFAAGVIYAVGWMM
jgi:hypothetical protein